MGDIRLENTSKRQQPQQVKQHSGVTAYNRGFVSIPRRSTFVILLAGLVFVLGLTTLILSLTNPSFPSRLYSVLERQTWRP
jgi:hypothetical protein